MPNILNYTEEFLKAKPISDLFDFLTIFSTGYLLMLSLMTISHRLRRESTTDQNESELYYEQVIFVGFLFLNL